jgi:hypothetical protein
MIGFILRRALWGAFVVALVTSTVFVLIYAAGDPAAVALSVICG